MISTFSWTSRTLKILRKSTIRSGRVSSGPWTQPDPTVIRLLGATSRFQPPRNQACWLLRNPNLILRMRFVKVIKVLVVWVFKITFQSKTVQENKIKYQLNLLDYRWKSMINSSTDLIIIKIVKFKSNYKLLSLISYLV